MPSFSASISIFDLSSVIAIIIIISFFLWWKRRTFRHITRLRAPQRDLLSQGENLRRIFESIQDYAIFMMTPEGIVTTWNPGAEMMKGYKADEILGQCFSRFYLPSDIEAGKPHMLLSHAAQAGRVTDEGWRVRKDGTNFWASIVITALYNRKGEVQGYAKITQDMTERKRAEMALHNIEIWRPLEEFGRPNVAQGGGLHSVTHNIERPQSDRCGSPYLRKPQQPFGDGWQELIAREVE